MLSGTGPERTANPLLARAGNDRNLLDALATLFLSQLGKQKLLELRYLNDLSDHWP